MRNFLATLMLSQGVPMLSHGDEFGRTQRGNNNAYCQDNELAWIDWPDAGHRRGGDEAHRMHEFTRTMVWLRRDHPVFRRRRFFHGRPVEGTHDDLSDIAWFTPRGREMTAARLAGRARPVAGRLPQRQRDLRAGAARRAGHRRLLPADVQRRTPSRWSSWCRSTTARSGSWSSTPSAPDGVPPGTGERVTAGDRLLLADRSMVGAAAAGD